MHPLVSNGLQWENYASMYLQIATLNHLWATAEAFV